MTRKMLGLCFVALIAVSTMVWATQFPVTVQDISVTGNDQIKSKDILDVVPFKEGDAVEEADLKSASQAVFDLGWFGEVSVDRSVLDEGHVVFQVTENPVVEDIVITGNTHRQDYKLFGIKLFDAPIIATYKIKQILRQDGVKKRHVLNRADLTTGLQDVISEYQKRGYVLVSVGNVEMKSTLKIEFVEQEYAGSLFEGLDTVPETVAQGMVDIPVGQPLRMADFQAAYSHLNQSVYFTDVKFDTQTGTDASQAWLKWTLTETKLLDEPTQISRIEIEGNTEYSTEALESLLGDIPADPIGNYELLQLVEGIYDRYIGGGYSMVRLSVASIENGVLHLKIDEGRISEVAITGNTSTHTYVISRNVEIHAGEVLNRNDLLVTYQQLNSLGYFDAVDIVPEWTDDGVKVTLTITEKSSGLGGFSGSLAIDPSTGELYGELSLSEKNLLGTGQDVKLSYNRGLIGKDDTSPSTWSLDYSTVAFFPDFDRVGLSLYQKTEQQDDDQESDMDADEETGGDDQPSDEDAGGTNVTVGAQVSFSYPIGDYSTLDLGFRSESEQLAGESYWTPTQTVNVALSYDDTNDPAFPTEGSTRRLSLEKAGGFSAGREYNKVDLSWTDFIPVSMPLIDTSLDQAVAIRIKTGWADAGLPESKWAELGGPTSIRGVSGNSARHYALSNLEYRVELTEGLYVKSFLDAGLDLSAARLENVAASFGFELGINAAGVLVRLDLAWPVDREFSWVPVFDFGFGPMF